MITKKIKKYILNPKLILKRLDDYRLITLKDEDYINMRYETTFNKKLNLEDPQTFNEKLQWLKLYDRNPKYTKLVDKYEVKDYVANLIGKQYIVPTIGIYDKWKDINFKNLPNQFVIKCTHDSASTIVCREKTYKHIKKCRGKIKRALKKNYFYGGREWPYKNVKPRIIIEKYIFNTNEEDLKDYKFFCFDGKVKVFKIDFDRFSKHQANYYDCNGNLLEFGEEVCPPDFNKKLEIPGNLKKMIELAEKLSENIPFVRIDFYDIDNKKIYFGEMTFYPAAGFGKFEPEEWDYKLGKLIDLTKVKKYEK